MRGIGCFHEQHIDHFAALAAESERGVNGGKLRRRTSDAKTAQVAGMKGLGHRKLFPYADGFDVGDDAPAVIDSNGGGQGRLSAFAACPVADMLK